MSRFALLALAGLALAACESPVTPAPVAQRSAGAPVAFNLGGPNHQNVTAPLSGYLYSPCNGEIVNVAGTEHAVVAYSDTTYNIHVNTSDVAG
ncbi:MAG: hypothetical protein KGL38_09425, partial [Gemmatimonadota bacterium]|nr:hypothetical protein [Gemmatimonadota bacterium]